MALFKNYTINILIRVIAILCMCFGVVYFGLLSPYWTVGLWMLLFVMLTTINLISYTQKAKREMVNFLLAIKQKDFTTTSLTQNNELQYAQREIVKVFQHLNQEKEFEHQYLESVVDHIQVALICFEHSGEVKLFNKAASELFQLQYVKNIRELKYVDNNLLDQIQSIRLGEKKLLKLYNGESLFHLSLQCSTFKLQKQKYKLVSFQDIKAELEENELVSWQKLIKVMTHEIKNSAIPIATLTDVIHQQFNDEILGGKQANSIDQELVNDLKISLNTVANRSKGLVNFVSAYNSLTKLPTPNIESIDVHDLIVETKKLMEVKTTDETIDFSVVSNDNNLQIQGDKKLIEQLFLNLIINAIDAVKSVECPMIRINTFKHQNGNVCIQIVDNGVGIPPEKLDEVFIPFFTTKSEGSGIGLSLSRQIMRMHKGGIEILSSNEQGTTIQLTF